MFSGEWPKGVFQRGGKEFFQGGDFFRGSSQKEFSSGEILFYQHEIKRKTFFYFTVNRKTSNFKIQEALPA